MTKDLEGKSQRQARWVQRYGEQDPLIRQILRRHLLKQRQQAEQEPPPFEPSPQFPPLLHLKLPFRPKRPTQVPRIRLIPPQLRPPQQPLRYRPLPIPLRLPLLHALLSFTFLALLPQRPISIPTALGLAFATGFYLHFAAYQMGYRWRKDK